MVVGISFGATFVTVIGMGPLEASPLEKVMMNDRTARIAWYNSQKFLGASGCIALAMRVGNGVSTKHVDNGYEELTAGMYRALSRHCRGLQPPCYRRT